MKYERAVSKVCFFALVDFEIRPFYHRLKFYKTVRQPEVGTVPRRSSGFPILATSPLANEIIHPDK